MSDIVDRLRIKRDQDVKIGPLLDAEREEAAAEIERLHEEVGKALRRLESRTPRSSGSKPLFVLWIQLWQTL